jgi:hypothetical protein
MGMFYINSLMFDMDVINDTVMLGATEEWVVLNGSDIAHPFHIHGGSFWILDRDGQAPHPWEQGAKDMVLVDMAEQVHLLMKFDELTDGWPFMYHCHNLMHEDNMMMLQYIVVDPSTTVVEAPAMGDVSVFPSPTASAITYRCRFAVEGFRLMDMLGREVGKGQRTANEQGQVELGFLRDGSYVLELRGGAHVARTVVVKE